MFGFKKKTTEKVIKELEPYKFLAESNRKQGDLLQAFYFEHKPTIDFFDNEITAQLVNAKSENSLQFLYAARDQFEAFRQWCFAQKGGKEFYDQHIRIGPDRISRIEQLEKQIAAQEYVAYTVKPTILDRVRSSDGIKQADICKEFDISREEVLAVILDLESERKLKCEKRGKFVYLLPR